MRQECGCGNSFRTAEDFRDHLPCEALAPVFEPKTVYRYATTDGYTHSYEGPFYPTFAEADVAGKAKNGGYHREPKPFQAHVTKDGRVFLVEGPYMMASAVEARKAMQKAALAKLTKGERDALGIDEGDYE